MGRGETREKEKAEGVEGKEVGGRDKKMQAGCKGGIRGIRFSDALTTNPLSCLSLFLSLNCGDNMALHIVCMESGNNNK